MFTLPEHAARQNPFKIRLRGKSIQLLANASSWAVAKEIEESIYLVTLQQNTPYEKKVLQIAWNLRQNGVYLLSKYPPRHIPYLDNKQLAETTEIETWWATYDQRIDDDKILLNEEAKFDENEQLSTTTLACHRCHSRLIAIHQQQIRSADEGMTVFCTCKKCGTRWKM